MLDASIRSFEVNDKCNRSFDLVNQSLCLMDKGKQILDKPNHNVVVDKDSQYVKFEMTEYAM